MVKYCVLIFGLAAVVSAQVSSGNPLRCIANAGVPPIIRAEGRAELAGDLVIECQGGAEGSAFTTSLSITANTMLTGKRVGDKTEMLLLVDEPYLMRAEGPGAPATVGVNVFQGISAAGSNQVTFPNIRIVAPGPNRTRVFRFTNLRVDATALGVSGTLIPTQVVAFVSALPAGTLPIDNPQQTIAFILRGVLPSVLPAGPNGNGRFGLPACNPNNQGLLSGSGVGAKVDFLLRFREGFQTAWRPRLIARERNLPGEIFHDESAYLDSSFPATDGLNEAGVPTSGTKLRATFSNIPAGMVLFVTKQPLIASAQIKATMTRIGTPTLPDTSAAYNGYQVPITQVPVVNGTATLEWLIEEAPAGSIEQAGFGLAIAHAGNLTARDLQVAMGFAPAVSGTPEQYNLVPRFQAESAVLETIPLVACGTVPAPDLSVGTRTSFRSFAAPGTPVGGTIEIRNSGSAQTAPFDYTLDLVNSANQVSASLTHRAADGLPPYSSFTAESIVLPITSNTAPGSYTLRIRLDSAAEVAEGNEQNNTRDIPITVNCGQTLRLRTLAVPAAGGSVAVPLDANCAFEVFQKSDWIQISGNNFILPPNTTGQLRTGNVRFGLESLQIWQEPMPAAGCSVALTDSTPTTTDSGGRRTISLSTGPQCPWAASTNVPWLQVFPIQGTGPANLQLTVFPNFGMLPRIGQIMSNGAVLGVTQRGPLGSTDYRAVRQIYFNFFGRLPSEAEAAYQKTQLELGISIAELVERFWVSMEFGAGGRFVAGLYVGILNREAEYGGWLFQRNAMSTSIVDQPRLVENFLNSAEFRMVHGNITDLDLVKLLYRQILLREGNQTEWDFHLGTLRTGRVTRNQMVENFLNSAEFRAGTGPRLTAFLLYAAIQNREPNAQEFEQMKARVAAGTPLRDLITTLIPGFNGTLQ